MRARAPRSFTGFSDSDGSIPLKDGHYLKESIHPSAGDSQLYFQRFSEPFRAFKLTSPAPVATISGLFDGEWRSLAARLPWEQEVDGSNPSSPIRYPSGRDAPVAQVDRAAAF